MCHSARDTPSRAAASQPPPTVNSAEETAAMVREIRERTGLTQEKFAASLGVTFPTINRWENGRTRPSPLALIQLREMLQRMGERGTDLALKHFP